MSSAVTRATGRWTMPAFTDGQLEAIKWVAFGTMLIDHFGRYAFGLSEHSWIFAVSRITFPLFALVLAYNLARPGDRAARATRTAVRLWVWVGISLLPSWWARGTFLPVNVLATLALGASIFAVFERTPRRDMRTAAILFSLVSGLWVEFSAPGVLLVFALAEMHRRGGACASTTAVVAFALVTGLNLAVGGGAAGLGTLVSIPLAWAMAQADVQMRRRKWWFYASYPAHLLSIAAMRVLELHR